VEKSDVSSQERFAENANERSELAKSFISGRTSDTHTRAVFFHENRELVKMENTSMDHEFSTR